MPKYIVKPIEPGFVMERRRYIKDGETPFTVELYYESVVIFITTDEEELVIKMEDRVFGQDINKYLKNNYPHCDYDTNRGCCLGQNSPDMPEYLREKIDDKRSKYSIYDYWNDCVWMSMALSDYDWVLDYPVELWVYTEDFSITKITKPPPPPQLEPNPHYEYALVEPLEEVKWDEIVSENNE